MFSETGQETRASENPYCWIHLLLQLHGLSWASVSQALSFSKFVLRLVFLVSILLAVGGKNHSKVFTGKIYKYWGHDLKNRMAFPDAL